MVFLLVVVSASTYLVLNKLNANRIATNAAQTALVLRIAKDALISFAATYPDRLARGPGYLPCPDKNNNGAAEPSCALIGNIPTTGWFPFETVELSDIRDGSGARLWYALSSSYRSSQLLSSSVLNSDDVGDLIVDSRDDIVAVIIAPGKPVANQNRVASYDAADGMQHYLEGDNAVRNTNFVTTLGATVRQNGEYDTDGNHVFNDQLVLLTRHELMSVVEKRVLGEVARVLSEYQSRENKYPWLSSFADPLAKELEAPKFPSEINTYEGHVPLSDLNGTSLVSNSGDTQPGLFSQWFEQNQWHHLIYVAYAMEPVPGGDTVCAVNTTCLGIHDIDNVTPITRDINNIRALAIIAGPALDGITRPSNSIEDYFEEGNRSSGDRNFTRRKITEGFNDQIRIIATLP